MESMLTPKKDALVETPDGKGIVLESAPLTGMVKVKLNGADEEPPKTYHRDLLVVIPRCPRAAEKHKEEPTEALAEEPVGEDA